MDTIKAPWGGYMPTDLGAPFGSEFMLLPKASLPEGAKGSLEETVDAAVKAPAPPKEKKPGVAFTPEQLAVLANMAGAGGASQGMRAPASAGVSSGGRSPVQMAQLQTQAVGARPSLAQILYGRK